MQCQGEERFCVGQWHQGRLRRRVIAGNDHEAWLARVPDTPPGVVTDRDKPALTLERDGAPAMDALFLGLVSNTSPWTYLGERPVNASPGAGFDTGLDLFALRKLSALRTLNALRQMLGPRGPAGKYVVNLHDQDTLTFRATRPVAFQVDGEYMGEREHVILRSIPNALRVLA